MASFIRQAATLCITGGDASGGNVRFIERSSKANTARQRGGRRPRTSIGIWTTASLSPILSQSDVLVADLRCALGVVTCHLSTCTLHYWQELCVPTQRAHWPWPLRALTALELDLVLAGCPSDFKAWLIWSARARARCTFICINAQPKRTKKLSKASSLPGE